MDEFGEGIKLTIDFVKHITTLDTGLVVILATLYEKVFNGKVQWKRLLNFCVFSLSISLLGCIIFMGFSTIWSLYPSNRSYMGWIAIPLTIGYYFGVGSFFLAIIFFILFTFKNFNSKSRQFKKHKNPGTLGRSNRKRFGEKFINFRRSSQHGKKLH